MSTYTLTKQMALRRRAIQWRDAALGMFLLSLAVNLCTCGARELDRQAWAAQEARYQTQLHQAERAREQAVQELGALAFSTAQEREARAEQAEAYEAIRAWEYIGACTVTAYCPCAACCGRWADGTTSTGLPAGPGIVAVDPDVIRLGSTVIIDGQKYLAADTGVKGLHVDVCCPSHQEAEAFGARELEVWILRADCAIGGPTDVAAAGSQEDRR